MSSNRRRALRHNDLARQTEVGVDVLLVACPHCGAKAADRCTKRRFGQQVLVVGVHAERTAELERTKGLR